MAFDKGGIVASIVSKWDDKGVKAAQRDFARMAQTTKQSSNTVRGFNTSLKGLGLTLGGAAIIGGMMAFTKNAIAMALESRKTVARLDQVAKSMGVYDTVLGGTTRRLTDYAQELQNTTGISDETTKSAQAILLTFEQLAQTAGTAGGMFDRATAALLDLSAVGFGDATTNAKSLGKALQDPIKGLTALGRQGITFTAQEKDKIKALVASNRTLEAQTIIMEAVEKQVGGAAAAVATEFDKLGAAAADAQEIIGLSLVDALNTGVQSLGGSEGLGPAMLTAAQDIGDFVGAIGLAIEQVGKFDVALGGTDSSMFDFIGTVYRLTPGLGGLIQMTEGMVNVGEHERRVQQELTDEIQRSIQMRRIYSTVLSENTDDIGDEATHADRAAAALKRLAAQMDAVNGRNRSIIANRIELRRDKAEGPDKSGQRKGADGKMTQFTTADDKKQWALGIASTAESLAKGLADKGKFQAAINVYETNRSFIADELGSGFAKSVLSTPKALKTAARESEAQKSQDASRAGAENYQKNTAAVYNTFNIEVTTKTPAETVEMANRLKRLAALDRATAGIDWQAVASREASR